MLGVACAALVVFVIVVAVLHRKKRKSTAAAYFLWFFFGALGFHKFYMRKTALGFLYIVTAGLFLIGLLVDLFTLPGQVKKFNQRLEAPAK